MSVVVRDGGTADRDAVAAMFARAFEADPAMTWIFPDAADRARRLPRLFRLLYDSDRAAGAALLADEGAAATLWRAPGHAHTPLSEMLLKLVPVLRATGPALRRALILSSAIERHMPRGDFWYLHVAGCDPDRQGRGLGSAAIRAGLARAGQARCYLETATERNITTYGRLGFRVTDEWTVPGGGPRFWSMLRDG